MNYFRPLRIENALIIDKILFIIIDFHSIINLIIEGLKVLVKNILVIIRSITIRKKIRFYLRVLLIILIVVNYSSFITGVYQIVMVPIYLEIVVFKNLSNF